MQLVARIVAIARALRLSRQLRQIESAVAALSAPLRDSLATLTVKELANAARAESPHLYGSPADKVYQAWGEGADVGFERALSDNAQVRVRGIALWIAVVYHETENADHTALVGLHKQVLRLMRLIKESAGAKPEVYAQWRVDGRGEAA
jgi:hypothetical protein